MTDLKSTLKIGKEIARGHFGQVHIGNDGIRNELAVKVLRALPEEHPDRWADRKAGLLKEGASLEKAKHRHVVEVHYLCEARDDDAIHLVMEFCHGGSLEPAYRNGPIRGATVLKVAREVCLGLAALHDRGMVHRDIKPGNILLDRHGVAKISDFGFVTDDIIEGYAAGAGYLDHLAPEYFESRVTSVRSDLWALGVTLYRLLHGNDWYNMGPAPRFVVPEGGFANSLQWLPHIGKPWRRVIRSLLSDDPSGRPENARALLRSLAALEGTEWECMLNDRGARWIRKKGGRRVEVVLDNHNPRKCSWSATSYPENEGRSRTLGGNTEIGYRQAEKELRQFFG